MKACLPRHFYLMEHTHYTSDENFALWESYLLLNILLAYNPPCTDLNLVQARKAIAKIQPQKNDVRQPQLTLRYYCIWLFYYLF